LNDAHGKGMAIQFNYLMDQGAVTANEDSTFGLNIEKFKQGVRDLTHDLLTLEAEGDVARAKKLQDELGIVRPALKRSFERLQGIPTDIEPIFVTADELAPPVKPATASSKLRRNRRAR
jgi:hypothetical protein